MKRVKHRDGEHLMLIKWIGTNDYMAALHWDEPPTIAAVGNAVDTHGRGHSEGGRTGGVIASKRTSA